MGQKNVVEIIFDTSESMGWSVDKNSTTSRLEIARYALRELMDNVILTPTKRKTQVTSFHCSKIQE